MFYILKSEDRTNKWIGGVELGWLNGLSFLLGKSEVKIVTFLDKNLTENDNVILPYWTELKRDDVKNTKAKIIHHINTSGCNPAAFYVDKDIEKMYFEKIIDVVTFSSKLCKNVMMKNFPEIKQGIVTGYPLIQSNYNKYKNIRKKKKIVIPGRLSYDKQIILSEFLLENLVDEYEIIFSAPTNESMGIDWFKFINVKEFEDKGFKFKINNQEQYLKEISDAEIVFTASLGDTTNFSIYEGILLGCYPVIPAIFNRFPTYMSYVSKGYKPFDREDVEFMIRNKPKIDFDSKLFDHIHASSKLINGLKNCKKIKDEK